MDVNWEPNVARWCARMKSSGNPEHLNLEQHYCKNLNCHRWHVPGGFGGQNLKFTSTQTTVLIGEKLIQIQLNPSPSHGNPRLWQLYRRVLVGPLCLKWGMFKHLQSFSWLGKRTHLVMWRQTLDVIGQPNLYHVECLRHNFAVTWCLDAILAVFGVRVSDVVDKQKLLVVFITTHYTMWSLNCIRHIRKVHGGGHLQS